MPTRNTGTILQDIAGNNVTRTHLSTHILLKVQGNVVGAAQGLDVSEDRSIKMIDEIGNDGHIDSAPSASTNITGSCERVRFGRMRITEAFSRGFIHVGSQRIPFDLEIHDIFIDNNLANVLLTVIENMWIKSVSYSYRADNFIITERMNWEAERIHSTIGGNNVVTGAGNGLQFPIIRNVFEQEADRGAFTGALDAPGLLNAFLADPRN